MSLVTIASFAQKEISLEEVKNHINDSVEVTSKISAVSYFPKAKNGPAIFYLGSKSPKQLLTVIIYDDVRKKFDYNILEDKYRQAVLIVNGKVELVKGKPHIIVRNPRQLGFIYDEVVIPQP